MFEIMWDTHDGRFAMHRNTASPCSTHHVHKPFLLGANPNKIRTLVHVRCANMHDPNIARASAFACTHVTIHSVVHVRVDFITSIGTSVNPSTFSAEIVVNGHIAMTSAYYVSNVLFMKRYTHIVTRENTTSCNQRRVLIAEKNVAAEITCRYP